MLPNPPTNIAGPFSHIQERAKARRMLREEVNRIASHALRLKALADEFASCDCLACRQAAFDYSNAATYWDQAANVYDIARSK